MAEDLVIPAKNVCNAQYAVDFVKQNGADATQVAQQLNVLPEDILGLSAAESPYGTGVLVTDRAAWAALDPRARAAIYARVKAAGGAVALSADLYKNARKRADDLKKAAGGN